MRSVVLAFVVVMTLGLVHQRASAQSTAIEGTFTAANASQQQIDEAIESAVSQMNFVTRPIARGRLKKTNPAYQRIRIERAQSEISIQFDERQPVQMPADGHAVKWTREDGEVFDVSATTDSGALLQTFKAEDGQRTNRFSLSADANTLTLEVTITSPRLPAPVKYALTYLRQGQHKNPHLEFNRQ